MTSRFMPQCKSRYLRVHQLKNMAFMATAHWNLPFPIENLCFRFSGACNNLSPIIAPSVCSIHFGANSCVCVCVRSCVCCSAHGSGCMVDGGSATAAIGVLLHQVCLCRSPILT